MSKSVTLAVDTSTRSSVVVLGAGEPLAVSRREVRHRHGTYLLEQLDDVLAEAGCSLEDVASLAVGTGPGSFTGLRVGLATVKTMAYVRSLPLVGVSSADALRAAGARAGAPVDAAVVLPAGAHDHYLARAGADPMLIAPGELAVALEGQPVLAIDLEAEPLGPEAARLGNAALEALPQALLELARERLAGEHGDDIAELTPAYVALPRGVKRAAEDLGWSPDLR